MFKRGLKDNIKDELIRDSRSYESLIEIIEIAIDFDDKLYEIAIEKRYNGGLTSGAGYYSRRPSSRYNFSKLKKSRGSYFGPILMELDST